MHFREHVEFRSFSVLSSQGFCSLFRDEFLISKRLDRLVYLIAVFFSKVSVDLTVKLAVPQLSVGFLYIVVYVLNDDSAAFVGFADYNVVPASDVVHGFFFAGGEVGS